MHRASRPRQDGRQGGAQAAAWRAAEPARAEQLKHEHAVLRAFEVPGVIRALGLEELDRKPVLVLEAWGDTSLARVLDQGPLPLGVALRLGAALSRSLGEVHRRGLLHRDIKPHNVLVDAERTHTCLIDFGLATWWTPQLAAQRSPEAVSGTLAYMAPEQTGRMNRAPDARADLYALGATLYQMLTGALPFEATDALELIHAHIARAPVPPHERAPERSIPEAVSAIVLKLMAKSPEHRYQTASGAAWDLERAARAWVETGTVAPFPLAKRDWEDRVRAPSRLFGRERESAALAALFDEACGGATVLALVAGRRAWSKSALVQALQGQVRARRGIFASGKFDQLQRSTPYAALAQALRSVVRRRLADPAEVLERWRQAWQEAAGPNGQILDRAHARAGAHPGRAEAAGGARADGGQAPLPDDGAALRADAWPRPSTRWCCSSTTCSGRMRRRFRSWASC